MLTKSLVHVPIYEKQKQDPSFYIIYQNVDTLYRYILRNIILSRLIDKQIEYTMIKEDMLELNILTTDN